MKKNNNIIKYIGHAIAFMFFMGFVYFSYFTAKELLVVKYITPTDHAVKYNSWAVSDCLNPYSYQHHNRYSDEANFSGLSYNEKTKKIAENNKDIIKACTDGINKKAHMKLNVDFKINFIKYGLATLFFFILFMGFTVQNYFMYKKDDK